MENIVYIGPTFRDRRLNQFMTFTDGYPPEANEQNLKHLFIPVSKLNEALQELHTKGSQLAVFYELAIKEGGLK